MALTREFAQAIIQAALKSAQRQQVSVAIAVVDREGRVIAAARDEQAGPINLDMAIKKAATAAAFGQATSDIAASIREASDVSPAAPDPNFSFLPGGRLVRLEDEICGAIGVAGGHYSQDETIAIETGAAMSRVKAMHQSPDATRTTQADFAGKHVVITGALGAIGLLACELFARGGARVLGLDRQEDDRGAKAADFKARGFDISFEQLDVADVDAIARFGAAVGQSMGHADILVNNAGILSFMPLVLTSPEEWDRVQNINCRSAYLMTRAIAPLMGGEGVILNISSSAALSPAANMAAYAVAKMGLVTLSKVSAREFGPGIRVNAICPGPLDTAMPRNYLRGNPLEKQIMSSMIDHTIVKRLGEASEIAELVGYLASDKASFITGTVITADGGFIG